MDRSSAPGTHRLVSHTPAGSPSASTPKPSLGWLWFLRLALTLIGIFCCYRLATGSVRNGVARLFSMVAIFQNNVEPTDKAVNFAPTDPEAHYTRALSLVNALRLDEALQEFRMATQLRPHHYYEWLDLGVTLERMGNDADASEALKKSIRLAPSFAQPRWQLGNLLYRQGRFDEAFAELRLAVKTNPNLIRSMVELAGSAANENVASLEAFVRPETTRAHLELARFLAAHANGAAATNQVKQAGEPADELERTLLQDTILVLLDSKQFPDARAAWLAAHPLTNVANDQILNGDFLEPIKQDDPGFGWQIHRVPNVVVSIDPSGPTAQTRSMRLEFGGDSAPLTQTISQLVLLPGKSRYKLSFMARTENLVSGGPPVIQIIDTSDAVAKSLGQSNPITSGKGAWSTFEVDFATDENSSAITVALERLPCNQSPCPIFGTLWLSRFSIVKP